MKKLFISFAALLSVLSCTEKLPVTPDPAVDNQGICLVNVTMEDDTITWSALNSKIGVYSNSTTNAQWRLRSIYDGRTGIAEFFGEAATGSVYAYYPYSSDGYAPCATGRVNVAAEQKWCDSYASHMQVNSPYMVAVVRDGALQFKENLGAVHVKVKMDFPENIQYISLSASEFISGDYDVTGEAYERITGGTKSIKLNGIDKPSSLAEPLEAWIALPPGTYSGLFLTVAGDKESITAVIDDGLKIVAGAQTEVDAKEQHHDYDGSDFEGEPVEFD